VYLYDSRYELGLVPGYLSQPVPLFQTPLDAAARSKARVEPFRYGRNGVHDLESRAASARASAGAAESLRVARHAAL
jgi:hypothetical protein